MHTVKGVNVIANAEVCFEGQIIDIDDILSIQIEDVASGKFETELLVKDICVKDTKRKNGYRWIKDDQT